MRRDAQRRDLRTATLRPQAPQRSLTTESTRWRRLRRAAAVGSLLIGIGCSAAPASADWPSRQIPSQAASMALPVVSSVCLHPSGQFLATAGDDHLVRIWSTVDGRLRQHWSAHGDWVRSIAYSPDGSLLATAGNDGRIVLWDIAEGRAVRTVVTGDRPVAMIRFSSDGRYLASTGFEDKLRVYDVATAQVIHELDCPCRDMRAMAFSPDHQYLAAGGRNGRIRIWKLVDGQSIRQIEAHTQRIRSLEYSSDGVYLVSAGEDRLVRVWNMLDSQVHDLPPLGAKVLAMVFCGPEKIAIGMSDNTIRLWDLAGRKEVTVLRAHQGSVCSLDYRDGLLVSGSFDTTVRLWDLKEAVARRPDDPALPR